MASKDLRYHTQTAFGAFMVLLHPFLRLESSGLHSLKLHGGNDHSIGEKIISPSIEERKSRTRVHRTQMR